MSLPVAQAGLLLTPNIKREVTGSKGLAQAVAFPPRSLSFQKQIHLSARKFLKSPSFSRMFLAREEVRKNKGYQQLGANRSPEVRPHF